MMANNSKTTLKDILNAARANQPNLQPDAKYTLEQLTGSKYWNKIPKGERTRLGISFKAYIRNTPGAVDGATADLTFALLLAARERGAALLLGIAYAATIGGMGTIIGTPPNALFAAFMAERNSGSLCSRATAAAPVIRPATTSLYQCALQTLRLSPNARPLASSASARSGASSVRIRDQPHPMAV